MGYELYKSSMLNEKLINLASKHYKGKFILATQHPKSQATDELWYYFWTDIPHPEGSNYFGIGFQGDRLVICNGIIVESIEFDCIIEDDIIYYSLCHHDFVSTPSGMFIDGGRSYTRSSCKTSMFKVVNGEIVVQ